MSRELRWYKYLGCTDDTTDFEIFLGNDESMLVTLCKAEDVELIKKIILSGELHHSPFTKEMFE